MSKTFLIRNGDVVLDATNGRPQTVSDLNKVKQDMRECLAIDVQTDNGFGASLNEMVGQLTDELSPGGVNFNFGLRAIAAVQRLIQLQRTYQYGQRSMSELISKIVYCRCEPDRTDPTLFRFLLRMTNVLNEVIRISGALKG